MALAYSRFLFPSRISIGVICLSILGIVHSSGQSGRYWNNAINEESSMLAGAVVGGGAGNSAIYFNPANIARAANSQFSLNTDLVNWDIYTITNALGEGLSLKKNTITFQPRFVSYLFTSERFEALKFQVAALSKEDYELELAEKSDQVFDILRSLPGEERYYGSFMINRKYTDYWVGAGMSYGLQRGFSLGISMFGSAKSLRNQLLIDNTAHPLSDTVFGGPQPIPFYSATYYYYENIRFNNYQLIWKIGLGYKTDKISLGINFTSPTVLLWADGKTVIRAMRQQNIMDPEETGFLPNKDITDSQYRKNVTANYKEPWSVAIGFTYRLNDAKHSFFSTMEYFHRIQSYNLIEAEESPIMDDLITAPLSGQNNWLNVVRSAEPVLNAAIGYRWEVNKNFLLLSGFKTDFNHQKKTNLEEIRSVNQFKGLDLDVYHITTGAQFNIKQHVIFTGFLFAFGSEKNLPYFVNIADPEEYSLTEEAALQGSRLENMHARYIGMSIYFGALFNFGTDDGGSD
jgi:hypothetical protein